MGFQSKKNRLIARPLRGGEEIAWDILAGRHGCFFDALRWTNIFEPRVERIGFYDSGDVLRGGFSLYEERRLGLRVLRNPPFTPQIGPFFEARARNSAARTNEQRDVVRAMQVYLSNRNAAVTSLGLSRTTVDCLPFFWMGYKVVPHYTYLIDLGEESETILAVLSKERRNDIRKAQKDGIEVEEATDLVVMHGLALETFRRQGLRLPGRDIEAIFATFPPADGAFCFVARDRGEAVAGVYVVYDEKTAYYLIGGYREGAHHGAGALAIYRAILRAKELGLSVFDFEGSVVPPIERFFRGFGGKLTPVFGVHKAWLPLELGLKVMKRQFF